MKTQPLSAVSGYAMVLVGIVGILIALLPLSAAVQALGPTPTPDGTKGIQKSNDEIMTEQAKITPSPGGRVYPAPGKGPDKQPNPDSPPVSSGGNTAPSAAMTTVVVLAIITVVILVNFYKASSTPAS